MTESNKALPELLKSLDAYIEYAEKCAHFSDSAFYEKCKALLSSQSAELEKLRAENADLMADKIFANTDKKLLAKAQAELAQARALLAEAAEDVEHWGAYADDYFQNKHNLKGDIAKYRNAAPQQPAAGGCRCSRSYSQICPIFQCHPDTTDASRCAHCNHPRACHDRA